MNITPQVTTTISRQHSNIDEVQHSIPQNGLCNHFPLSLPGQYRAWSYERDHSTISLTPDGRIFPVKCAPGWSGYVDCLRKIKPAVNDVQNCKEYIVEDESQADAIIQK